MQHLLSRLFGTRIRIKGTVGPILPALLAWIMLSVQNKEVTFCHEVLTSLSSMPALQFTSHHVSKVIVYH